MCEYHTIFATKQRKVLCRHHIATYTEFHYFKTFDSLLYLTYIAQLLYYMLVYHVKTGYTNLFFLLLHNAPINKHNMRNRQSYNVFASWISYIKRLFSIQDLFSVQYQGHRLGNSLGIQVFKTISNRLAFQKLFNK